MQEAEEGEEGAKAEEVGFCQLVSHRFAWFQTTGAIYYPFFLLLIAGAQAKDEEMTEKVPFCPIVGVELHTFLNWQHDQPSVKYGGTTWNGIHWRED